MYLGSFYVYGVVFGILFLLGQLERFFKTKVLSLSFLVLIFGFRLSFGNDYQQYVNIFLDINSYSTIPMIEPGAYFLNKLAFLFFDKNGVYFVFSIYVLLTFLYIYKSLEDRDVSRLFFLVIFISGFLFFSNNAIRQALSVAFLIYNLKNIEKKFKFIFNIIMSTLLFHYSSFIFITCLLIPKRNFKNVVYLLVLIMSFVVYKIGAINILFTEVVQYIPYYGAMYASRVSSFQVHESGSGLVVLFWYALLIYVLMYKDKVPLRIFNIYFFGCCIFLSGIQFELWERAFIPFFYINIIVWAIIINKSMFYSISGLLINSTTISILILLISLQIISGANKNKIVPFNNYFMENDFGIFIED